MDSCRNLVQSSRYFDAHDVIARGDSDRDVFHSVREFSSSSIRESSGSNLSSNNVNTTSSATSIDITTKNVQFSNTDGTNKDDNISTVNKDNNIPFTPNTKNSGDQESRKILASGSKQDEESQYLGSLSTPLHSSIVSDSSSPIEQGLLRLSAKPFFQTLESIADLDINEKTEPMKASSMNSPSPSTQQLTSSLSQEENNTTNSSDKDEKRFLVHDKDTGEKFDIRDLERYSSKESTAGYEVVCSLFKSKCDLIQQQDEPKSNVSSVSSIESEAPKRTASSKREKFKKIMKQKKGIESSLLCRRSLKKDKEKIESVSSADTLNSKELKIKNSGSGFKGKIFNRHSTSQDNEQSTTVTKENSHNNDSHEINDMTKKSYNTVDQKSSASNTVSTSSAPVPTTGINLRRSNGRKQQNQLNPGNAIPVKCYGKSSNDSDFHPMLMTQTINKAHDGPIWCMSLSNSGKSSQYYLATSGQDTVVLLWKLASSSQTTNKYPKVHSPSEEEKDKEQSPPPTSPWTGPSLGDEVQLIETSSFDQKPFRRLIGHEADVVDLSWSFTQFLLSASLDKTVRLWHPTRSFCLHIFRHADMVTCVDFHPFQDKYFVSGGYDKKLRIWSIPDGRVSEWAQTANIITASKYTPNGEYVVAGLYEGQAVFYSTSGSLKYYTQIICKNRNEKKGKKVTGICFLQGASSTEEKDENNENKQEETTSKPVTKSQNSKTQFAKPMAVLSPLLISAASKLGTKRSHHRVKEQMLITTNDSRLRLFGLNDYCMVRKYKGGKNSSMQIRARFSESGEFIVCGSDTGHVHLWNTATEYNPLRLNVGGINNYDKTKAVESFEATRAEPQIVTDTLFMPAECVEKAVLSSGLFPTLSSLDHIKHDLSSAAVVTADYEGTIRVFFRKACIDQIIDSAGPAGLHP